MVAALSKLIGVTAPQSGPADAQSRRYVLAADAGADRLADQAADLLVPPLLDSAQLSKGSRLHTRPDIHERAWANPRPATGMT